VGLSSKYIIYIGVSMIIRRCLSNCIWLGVLENVVVVTFQSVFYLKIYQNNVFLFFKNYF
jgi:hypothetical protein